MVKEGIAAAVVGIGDSNSLDDNGVVGSSGAELAQ